MRKGFTIVELLIVLTIMGILIGLVNLSTRRSAVAKGLESDAEVFIGVISNAREKAIARDLSTTNCNQLTSYQVNFASATRYNLIIECDTGTTGLQQYNLQGSTLRTTLPVRISFVANGYGLLPAPIALEFQNTRLAECIRVTISTAGVATRSARYACP